MENRPISSKPAIPALQAEASKKQHPSWLEENRAALEAYNRHVEHDGVFSDGLRTF